ncbi:MAG: DUF2490 domain-containing protein [Vicinamibacterales bacterium]
MARACGRLVLALLVCVGGPRAAWAQDRSEAQLWVQVLAIGQLPGGWRTHLEVQPRVMGDVSELGLTIVRTALGRQIAPRASLWIGYAWVPRTLGPGVQHEQRIWQQLLVSGPSPGRWTTTGRFRLEQRRLEPWADTSHRFRAMVRAQRRIGAGPWSLATYNEAMFTFDATSPGPERGYDRNRLYFGLVRRLSPALSLEGGYIWENSTIRGSLRRNDHVAIAVVNLAVPR